MKTVLKYFVSVLLVCIIYLPVVGVTYFSKDTTLGFVFFCWICLYGLIAVIALIFFIKKMIFDNQ